MARMISSNKRSTSWGKERRRRGKERRRRGRERAVGEREPVTGEGEPFEEERGRGGPRPGSLGHQVCIHHPTPHTPHSTLYSTPHHTTPHHSTLHSTPHSTPHHTTAHHSTPHTTPHHSTAHHTTHLGQEVGAVAEQPGQAVCGVRDGHVFRARDFHGRLEHVRLHVLMRRGWRDRVRCRFWGALPCKRAGQDQGQKRAGQYATD
jgi:hypothetical protein